MERVKVKSSNIAAVGYDATSQTLEVEFRNGSVYDYAGVPGQKYVELMQSPSIGSYFHKNIRSEFKAKKIGDVEVDQEQ